MWGWFRKKGRTDPDPYVEMSAAQKDSRRKEICAEIGIQIIENKLQNTLKTVDREHLRAKQGLLQDEAEAYRENSEKGWWF